MALFQPVLQALIAGLALAISLLLGIYVPKAIAAFEKRTGVLLTDQQREAVRDAANTAAGTVETMLQQGAIKLSQVTADNPAIVAQAQAALRRVPYAATAQGATTATMAAIIVGKADTVAAVPPPVTQVSAPPYPSIPPFPSLPVFPQGSHS